MGIVPPVSSPDLHIMNGNKIMNSGSKPDPSSEVFARIALVVATGTLILLMLSTFNWM